MNRCWKNLGALYRKNLDCLEEMAGRSMSVTSVQGGGRAQRGARSTVEKLSIIENTYITANRTLVEIRRRKVLLVRCGKFIYLFDCLFLFAFGREKNRVVNSALFICLPEHKHWLYVCLFLCWFLKEMRRKRKKFLLPFSGSCHASSIL